MGPRRIGKTVIVYQAIQELIDSGINPKKIFYYSLDTPIYTNISLEELISDGLSINRVAIEDSYFFFDEIQYLKDWEIQLKSLVDKNRKSKFIASGSAAAALRMKSIESGAGRFTDYFLPPLTFAEDLNGYNKLLSEIDDTNFVREYDGLLQAMKFFKLRQGVIVTFGQTDVFEKDGYTIQLIPAFKYLADRVFPVQP